MLSHSQTSFVPAAILRQSSLRIILLISHLLIRCVNTYTIDNSCRNYNGNDISADIQKAIDEVQDMAAEADAISLTEDESTNHLLDVLFGTDRSRHNTVRGYFNTFSSFSPTQNFVVICNDQIVELQQDFTNNPPDPRGVWVDTVYGWVQHFDNFVPCDYTRKPGAQVSNFWSYSTPRPPDF
ncbi:hypothetical protein XPA_003726 [Xanthoria parietina]